MKKNRKEEETRSKSKDGAINSINCIGTTNKGNHHAASKWKNCHHPPNIQSQESKSSGSANKKEKITLSAAATIPTTNQIPRYHVPATRLDENRKPV